MLEEFQAAGVQITTDLPAGAVRLAQLLHDGEELTPQTHASCPGRGAYFYTWNLGHAIHYCASPEEHGHTPRISLSPTPAPPGADGAAGGDAPEPGASPGPADEPPDPTRVLVIEGNKAWQAAAEVRKRWLADVLFAADHARAAPHRAVHGPGPDELQ